jgi:hypothetical protein
MAVKMASGSPWLSAITPVFGFTSFIDRPIAWRVSIPPDGASSVNPESSCYSIFKFLRNLFKSKAEKNVDRRNT